MLVGIEPSKRGGCRWLVLVLWVVLGSLPGSNAGDVDMDPAPSADGGSPGGAGGTAGAGGAAGEGGAAGGSNPVNRVSTPRFSVPGGTYSEPQSVAVTTDTPGATIHYTMDGNTPTAASPPYSDPVELAYGTVTMLRAFATAAGYEDSVVNSATYTIEPQPMTDPSIPTFAPPGGTYTMPLNVTISAATPGGNIHYTLDGSTPSAASPIYAAPIPLSTTTTISAIVRASNPPDSPVAKATYTFAPAAATPTFDPPAGSYVGTQYVMIQSATPNATIHYTDDGSTPSTNSPVLTAAVAVELSVTLRALAAAPGHADSEVADAAYDIEILPAAAKPVADPPHGTYCGPLFVSLSCATPGAVIRYALGGAPPDASSPIYSGPLELTSTTTLTAQAGAPNHTASSVMSEQYFIGYDCPCVPPVITPNGGTFQGWVEVTLTTTEPNGTISCTLDGSLPVPGTAMGYGGPITLTQSTALNAVTSAPGKLVSSPSTAHFTIVP